MSNYLLEECMAQIHSATCWGDILEAFEYAFHTEDKISEAVEQLNVVAESFRNSDKKSYDEYRLVLAVQAAPWSVQENFLKSKENADITGSVKAASVQDLERRVFEDRVAAGEELFRKIGLYTSVQELDKAEIDEEKYDKAKLALKTAQESYSALISNLGKIPDEDFNEQAIKIESQITEYNNNIKEIEKKIDIVLTKIKENLLQYSIISHEEAVKWVNDNVSFDASSIIRTLSEWEKEHAGETAPTPEKVKEELATIYRLTNGGIKNINIKGLRNRNTRACAQKKGNVICWDGYIDTLYHEAGHLFEYANQQHLAIAKRFIEDRATGDPQPLAVLTGKKYKRDEKAYPDNFSDPYVGKIYDYATEVLSMGLHTLGSKEMFLSGIKDMEHLEFCFGCFTSEPQKDNEIYDTANTMQNTDNARKTNAWIDALDNAMPDSFPENLYTEKGVARFKVVDKKHQRKLNGSSYDEFEKVLKYGSKIIARDNCSKNAIKRLARVAYLAICNLKELIPDADPLFDGASLQKLSCIPPNWFTPLTKLPRL